MIITTKGAMRKSGRSKRGHIIAAVDYVLRDTPVGRVKDIWTSQNIDSKDKNVIKGLMLSVAEMNVRSTNPVRHHVLSWRPEEVTSSEEKRQIIERLMRSIDAQDHQWVAVEHADKDGPHLHIVVSSINPNTFKANSFHQDTVLMMKELTQIVHEKGWDTQFPDAPEYQNSRYRVEGLEVIDLKLDRDLAMPKERERAKERHGPDMSMESYLNTIIKENLYPNKDALKGLTWAEFHQSIAVHGLSYEPKNTGAIWKWTHSDAAGQEVTETRKASVIPSFARGKLEKILGPYQAPEADVKPETGIHVASPTNPTMAAEAARDVGIIAKKAAQTRQQIRRRRLAQAQAVFLNSSFYQAQHLSGHVAQTQQKVAQALKLKVQKQAIKDRLMFANSPTYMDIHLIGGVAGTQKKIIQARQKLLQKRQKEEAQKARAELERQHQLIHQRQEQEALEREIERIRKEQEMESDNQKAPATPASTPARAGMESIDTPLDPPVQNQPNTLRAANDHEQEDNDEPSDKYIFIESIRVGQIQEAMEFIITATPWEECQVCIPLWWKEATGEDIPTDWEALYGPELNQEFMPVEEEPEEEIWR